MDRFLEGAFWKKNDSKPLFLKEKSMK